MKKGIYQMLLNFGKIMNYLNFRKLHIFPLPLAPSSQDLLALGESYSTGVELLIIHTRANSRLIVIARFRPFVPFKIQKTVSALKTI